jgi:hypothetical protein
MTANLPPVVVKTYQARTLADATALLQGDTNAAWADGYALSSQAWAPGGRTPAGIICLILGVLFLLSPVPIASISKNPIPILVLVGIALFFIYAGVVSRSPGTLSVTFARQR